mgnify:CR=1 FL=1
MKNTMGIKFNIVSEEDAYQFLYESNYFFKIKAFCKNYPKYIQTNSSKKGQYINLEFAYIKELSTIDAIFRKIVLDMVLDVEHFMKVQLIRDISENENEDGYTIIDSFINTQRPYLIDEIKSKSKNSYSNELINKYKDQFAIWNFIEIITFGDFISLYEFYYSKYENQYNLKGKLLPVKCLRNAAAHNNCLLNKLVPPFSKNIEPNKAIMNTISKIKYMPKKTREAKMKNPTIHDFVVLLDVYCTVIESSKTLNYGLTRLYDFFHNRCLKHKDYFENNNVIKSNYDFLVKVLDFYRQKLYNVCTEQKA